MLTLPQEPMVSLTTPTMLSQTSSTESTWMSPTLTWSLLKEHNTPIISTTCHALIQLPRDISKPTVTSPTGSVPSTPWSMAVSPLLSAVATTIAVNSSGQPLLTTSPTSVQSQELRLPSLPRLSSMPSQLTSQQSSWFSGPTFSPANQERYIICYSDDHYLLRT